MIEMGWEGEGGKDYKGNKKTSEMMDTFRSCSW